MIQFYGYAKCSTCLKAKKTLKSRNLPFQELEITVHPPDKKTLSAFLVKGGYTVRDLFNRSGEMYRSLDMKNKIPKMTDDEMLDLLSRHGKLIKRPLITDGKIYTVGFQPETEKKWKRL